MRADSALFLQKLGPAANHTKGTRAGQGGTLVKVPNVSRERSVLGGVRGARVNAVIGKFVNENRDWVQRRFLVRNWGYSIIFT